jgi:pimeloyl-ACP methyl ester carboxylesterase
LKLRLYHHPDGARIAYRESGTGPPLALLHSQGLTHREFEPIVDELGHRYRVVLPDLPLHGDSEDLPRHPYTPEWLVDVLAGFLGDTCGPHPLVAGHGIGAQLALNGVAADRIHPGKLVLLPNPMHTKPARSGLEKAGRVIVRGAIVPGVDRALSRAGTLVLRPSRGDRLTATGAPGVRDLIRHAHMDLGGNGNRVRSWAKAARHWPRKADRHLLEAYARMDFPILLLWADYDRVHPLAIAEEALDRLPEAQLRVLPRTGFLIAYDDPVGVARELAAFCG